MTNLTLLETVQSLKSVPYCYGLAPEQSRDYRNALAGNDLDRLTEAAGAAGFQLKVASGCRDFSRQLAIFNAKAEGARPVLDDRGEVLLRKDFSDLEWLYAILRFSALPGTSRHHWGTDFDVYDAKGLDAGQSVQLLAAESEPGGPFYDFHCWLDERIARGEAFGFFRPYDCDRGGVACEPWHISHKPSADPFREELKSQDLAMIYQQVDITLKPVIIDHLDAILDRFVV